MKAKKKPVEVEVYHLKDLSYKSVKECLLFMGQTVDIPDTPSIGPFDDYMHVVWTDNGITIKTLEGYMLASKGDYIIKGVQGEFYPCKRDIFKETYEIVED
ncbi:MAG: hypothetical protein RR585_01845 [Coprobacillus sp.]